MDSGQDKALTREQWINCFALLYDKMVAGEITQQALADTMYWITIYKLPPLVVSTTREGLEKYGSKQAKEMLGIDDDLKFKREVKGVWLKRRKAPRRKSK